MNQFLLLLDVPPPGPVQSVGWGVIMALLAVILVLSMAFCAGLVFLLIRYKRRKQGNAEPSAVAPEARV
ncbi:MAG TPA: hypothetical protein VEW46_02395 [Pyrinomonadaceae bacterium]|nr:hypothetical protein [Pyrinomonadaceae bacterium]